MMLDSFDAVVVVILPDGSRMLSESKLFPHKMFKALGVSPSVYVTIPRETWDPQKLSGSMRKGAEDGLQVLTHRKSRRTSGSGVECSFIN